MSVKLTKAVYARYVILALRRTTAEMDGLTEGMWNPEFCASSAEGYAKSFCDAMQANIDLIRAALTSQKEG